MIASICSASTRSSGRWSLISAYVRKPRSLPSLIRFLRRVRRVSASSLGSSAGISHSSLRLLRPPRPPLPLDLTSATLASSRGLRLLAGLVSRLRRLRLGLRDDLAARARRKLRAQLFLCRLRLGCACLDLQALDGAGFFLCGTDFLDLRLRLALLDHQSPGNTALQQLVAKSLIL